MGGHASTDQQDVAQTTLIALDLARSHSKNDYVKLLNLLAHYLPLHFRTNRPRCSRGRGRGSKAMSNLTESLDAAAGQQIDAILQRLRNSRDAGSDLLQVLDIVIGIVRADMGTLQRFDERNDCLKIVASRGLSSEVLNYFGIVRRDTNTACAAALTRRMRVFVEDVSTSYLFVGTRELDMLRTGGIAAAQSHAAHQQQGLPLGRGHNALSQTANGERVRSCSTRSACRPGRGRP